MSRNPSGEQHWDEVKDMDEEGIKEESIQVRPKRRQAIGEDNNLSHFDGPHK